MMLELNTQKTLRACRETALKVALFYVMVAAAWIFFSDAVVDWMISDPRMLTRIQTYKGWIFVLVTGLLLYLYLNRCLHRLHDAERQSAEQTEQMTMLFDAFQAIIYVADMETYELLFVNKYAAEFFGHDWRGKSCYNYLQDGMAAPCGFCTNNQLTVNGEPGPAITWEFRNTRNQHWYECLDKAIRWTDGRLVRLEIALDITERKELERTKDAMLSAVSHEMRTPLTAITGFTELLLDDPDVPPQVTQQLEIVFAQAEKMGELVNTFLDVRRLKTDRSRVDYEPLQLRMLLDKGIEACNDCKDSHEISISCPPGIEVYGNRKELTQVFTQLISNACRYSLDGGTVRLTATEEGAASTIAISDEGIGIPPEQHNLIFERFHRLDTGDSRRTQGAGLGLALAREIVILHGGKIWLDSTPDQGSTFYVSLPGHPPGLHSETSDPDLSGDAP